MGSRSLPRLSELAFDGRVFAIGVFVSLCTALLFGVVPSLQSARPDIQQVLQRSERVGFVAGYNFMKRMLVAGETALCLILLCGAALLLETLWHLRNDRLGFEPEHVLAVTIPLKGTKLETGNRDALVTDLLDFSRQIPGTQAVAQTECNPLSGGPMALAFSRSDRPLPQPSSYDDSLLIHVCGTSAGYAAAAGLRVSRGRFFSEGDGERPNTLAVLNETAARLFFPGEDAIGMQVMGYRASTNSPIRKWRTVVGVISDSKNRGLDSVAAPQVYINGVTYPASTKLQLLARTIGDQSALKSLLAGKLRSIDRGLTADFQPLASTISEMSGGARFNATLVGSFAAIAFVMALIGIYGVLAFAVGQRRQEIGIRMASGGARDRIFRLVLSEGLGPVIVGIAVGSAVVLGVSRYLKAVLYGVSATDPMTFIGVALALTMTAVIAISIPAHRASRVDPMTALRCQ
jgi:putative ABC transport system permease protein